MKQKEDLDLLRRKLNASCNFSKIFPKINMKATNNNWIKKQSLVLLIVLSFAIGSFGCDSNSKFQYKYLSPVEVEITYEDNVFRLHKYKEIPAPFEYEFEDDGDLDITIEGKIYELESPYDVDIKDISKKIKVKKQEKKKKETYKKAKAKKKAYKKAKAKKKKQSKATSAKNKRNSKK